MAVLSDVWRIKFGEAPEAMARCLQATDAERKVHEIVPQWIFTESVDMAMPLWSQYLRDPE